MKFFLNLFYFLCVAGFGVLLYFVFQDSHKPPPPKYDLVFSVDSHSSTNYFTKIQQVSGIAVKRPKTQEELEADPRRDSYPLSMRFSVEDGVLKVQYAPKAPVADEFYSGYWKQLYIYRAATQTVEPLPFPDPPDMETLKDTRKEVVAATKHLRLDPALRSPDGYEVFSPRDKCLFFFFIRRVPPGATAALKHDGTSIELAGPDIAPGELLHPDVIGWVLPEGEKPQEVAALPSGSKYDLILSTIDSPASYEVPLEVSYVVKDGALHARLDPNGNSQYSDWRMLYLFDAKTHNLRPIPFDYPARMDSFPKVELREVPAAKGWKIDPSPRSPDGFTLDFGRSFFDCGSVGWGMIRNGAHTVPLMRGNAASMTGNVLNAVGWVTGREEH